MKICGRGPGKKKMSRAPKWVNPTLIRGGKPMAHVEKFHWDAEEIVAFLRFNQSYGIKKSQKADISNIIVS